jgi:hypothetical protein
MRWIKAIAREVWGLFVDDGSFAFAILVWAAASAGIARIAPAAPWTGPVLFCGLALILIESVLRFARKPR